MLKLNPESFNMNKVSSVYLEILRIIAALYVFLYHFSTERFNDSPVFVAGVKDHFGLKYFSAHFFVIVFFVLSGFLITMSAKRPDTTFKSFLTARLGRLYSVLLPALLFSFLVFGFLVHFRHVAPSSLADSDHMVARFFVNLAFLTQSWSLCSTPPLNNPFWSVNYELMYYLMMGSLVLLGGRRKIWMFILFALVAGPKILLLFPAWLVGSALYFASKKMLLNRNVSATIFLATLAAIFYFMLWPARFPLVKSTGDDVLFNQTLFFSWNYQSDYLFSLLVAINIYAFFGVSKAISGWIESNIFDRLYKLVMRTGNCTYTLYLFHLPLLYLFAFALPYNKFSPLHQAGLALLVIASVSLIARVTEWKVVWWRKLVGRAVDLVYKFV